MDFTPFVTRPVTQKQKGLTAEAISPKAGTLARLPPPGSTNKLGAGILVLKIFENFYPTVARDHVKNWNDPHYPAWWDSRGAQSLSVGVP
jgi:hypothetical protein